MYFAKQRGLQRTWAFNNNPQRNPQWGLWAQMRGGGDIESGCIPKSNNSVVAQRAPPLWSADNVLLSADKKLVTRPHKKVIPDAAMAFV